MAVQEVPVPNHDIYDRVVRLKNYALISVSVNILSTHSVKPKSTWALLKPHYESLVSSYVFPQMSYTPAKQELWESDPVDYVRTTVG